MLDTEGKPCGSLLVIEAADLAEAEAFAAADPYAKAGLGYAVWSASNTGGTSEAKDSTGALVSGKGGSWGTQLALGVSFALDAIDRGASRNMDNATGINGSYVFFEAYWLSLNGLGQSNALRVGSNTWAMGLAFEF
jgi:ethanolamine utilization microcompartment shell protein EutL